ncbi:MAG: acyl-CoA desaturase [Bacteroidetes bacterium B1(2017)]|nr:MAG: acyl-CoA desaturase [Bacteroidetes bacterium B1(2017)]
MAKIKFNNSNALFFNTLRQRVDQYFEDKHIAHTGNFRLYLKTIILVSILVACYTTLVFFTPTNGWISLAICAIMGFDMAAIGFNVMHDGAHGSYSSKKWINNIMSYSLNVLGGSSMMWKQKHNINHHSYTNIEGMDDDIDIKPWIRVHPSQPKHWFNRFQHVYGLFLYGLTYLFWVFMNDFKKYFSKKISDYTPIRKMKVSEHIAFWGTKIGYVGLFLLMPFYFAGVANTLIGYSVAVFVCGLTIAVVFQLAHVVENAPFIDTHGEDTKIETEWAVHQLNTTFNFATKSKSVSWLLGGLNFQVEHHLFPKVSHVHYPQLNKILKATCKEFNVHYNEFPTVISALRSHLMHLKHIGATA